MLTKLDEGVVGLRDDPSLLVRELYAAYHAIPFFGICASVLRESVAIETALVLLSEDVWPLLLACAL